MRELRTTAELHERGITGDRIAAAIAAGRWTRIIRGVLGRGSESPTGLDVIRATAYATRGVARHLSAAALLDFDGVDPGLVDVAIPVQCRSRLPGVHRVSTMPDWVLVHQVRCTPGHVTLLDLARLVDDIAWEQALEFCLRKHHIAPHEVLDLADGSSEPARRIRRVITARGGLDVPHTDSLLETLAVQLLRGHGLPTPTRQHRIVDHNGWARYIDLCWPEFGIFLELDGTGHKDQPVYDATRQNEVTRITGWRCIRLTWDQVQHRPDLTARELAQLLLHVKA